MTDYNATKKAEHEKLAEAAARAKDWDAAATNLALAARFTLALAEQCEGAIAQAHIEEARQMAECAVELRKKAEKASVASPERLGGGDDEGGGAGKWQITKTDDIHFSDIIGLEKAKEVVEDTLINSAAHSDIYHAMELKPEKGLMLYGPPGTGKTMFAKAIATEMGLPFIAASASQLKDKWHGGSEKNVADLFDVAWSYGKCILFLDECDAILCQRENEKVSIVQQFLAQMDGVKKCESGSQLFVLLATNRPWMVDRRCLRSDRCSAKVYVGLPELGARRQMIEKSLHGVPLAPDVDLDRLARETEGFGGADICAAGGVCHKAKIAAARRWIKRRSGLTRDDPGWEREEQVTNDDLRAAVGKVVPAASYAADIIRRIAQWEEEEMAKVKEKN